MCYFPLVQGVQARIAALFLHLSIEVAHGSASIPLLRRGMTGTASIDHDACVASPTSCRSGLAQLWATVSARSAALC